MLKSFASFIECMDDYVFLMLNYMFTGIASIDNFLFKGESASTGHFAPLPIVVSQ